MEENSYSDTVEPAQLRTRHVLYANVASVGQSTATAGAFHTEPTPSRTQRRASPMASLPAYSDGLPYPEPKVVRRPVSRAVGWITSNLRRDGRRVRDKEKAKTLPLGREQTFDSLLSRLFKRNWSDNALHVRESGRTLSSVPSSLSSSYSRSGATFSNTAVSLASSSSSICDGGENQSPTGLVQPLVDVLSPQQLHGPAPKLGTRLCSEVNLSEPLEAEPESFIEFTHDMHLSRFGSCRDVVQEDNISGPASDLDSRLLQQHFPGAAVDVGSCLVDASLPDVGVVLPWEQVARTVTQFRCSIENLTLQASQDGESSNPANKGVQKRHPSDPTNAMAAGFHPQQKRKAHATQRVDEGATRPLSLCEPVEQLVFVDSRSSGNLTAVGCSLPLDPPGKGRLLAAVSTVDIRTPPTSMKVVRPSASYVDMHAIAKLDTEDDAYRQLVVKWILDTERSYLQALQTVIKVYMEPLQRHQGAVLEAEMISDIFYQVPQICNLHENFFSQLGERRDSWQGLTTIGDLFVSHFSSSSVVDMYTKFTSNFMNAKLTIQQMRRQHSSFARFLEQCARDNHEKLNLGDLLIKPIQRIPRYVLFIRDLLKHTVHSHPDHAHLELALEQLTALAEQMNEAEKEASNIDRLRDLAVNIDGASQLLAPRRWLLRHDFVIELRGTQQKKDRCIFLFNDLVLFATVRRKSSFRRNVLSVPHSKTPDFTVQPSPSPRRSHAAGMVQQMDQLQQDLATLAKIEELSQQLKVERQGLDSVIRETLSRVTKRIDECRDPADQAVFSLETARLNLLLYSSRPPTPYSLVFMDKTTKQKWEADFLEAKKAAEVVLKSRRAASMRFSSAQLTLQSLDFLHSLDLQPGRVGMKLTCAGLGLPTIRGSDKSLWVCRGDSYGGQVCLLNVEGMEKPNLDSSITVCNSEIQCIAMVPCGPQVPLHNSNSIPHLDAQSSSKLSVFDEAPNTVAQKRFEAGREGPEAGEQRPEAGGEGPKAGGEGPEAGGEGPEAGGEGPEARGEGPEAGGEGPETGEQRPEAGGEGPEAGGEGPEAGGEGPEAGGEGPEAGEQRPEARGELPETRELNLETEEQRMETGGEGVDTGEQRSEAGWEGPETAEQSLQTEEQRMETGGEWAETGAQRPEARRKGPQTGEQRSDTEGEGTETGEQRLETEEQRLEAGGEGPETGQQRLETEEQRMETGGKGPETVEQRLETEEQRMETGGEGPETGEQRSDTEGEGAETGEQRLGTGEEGPETGETVEQRLEAGVEWAETEEQRCEARGKRAEIGEQRWEAGGEGPEAGKQRGEAGEGPSSVQGKQNVYESLFQDFSSQESISTLTPYNLDIRVTCSPTFQQRGTISHLAPQEMCSAGQLCAPSCPLTDPCKGDHGQSAKESSLSHQSQSKELPLPLEESDSEPGGDSGNAFLSPGKDPCATAPTLDSARKEDRLVRGSWEGFQGTDVPLGSEDLLVRGRSHSAPPDPLEVIKAQLKNKSVTICESPEEISVQLEQPRRLSSVPAHSYSHPSENGAQSFSPLTLKPAEQSVQVWIGTGEGSIYVFRVGDNLRSRNKCVVPLCSSVTCIKYFDSCVYVGLENGSLVVFEMDEGGTWQLNSPHFLTLGSEAVLCCEPVLGDLWVASGNKVILLDTHLLTFQVLFSLPGSSSQPIATIVCIDQGVWLFTGESTHIHLYHATSSKHLATVDVTESVSNILSNLDPILRQHKLSCLRISSLAHVKSSLLIGTSAGVILLLPLPAIGTTSTAITGALVPVALTEGHAGPVSFVATVALKGDRSDMLDSAHKSEARTDMLVFSGGDGFEDFLSSVPPEDITDSSSCVNVWRC